MQLNGPLPLWQEDNPTKSIAAIIESNVLDQGLARTLRNHIQGAQVSLHKEILAWLGTPLHRLRCVN